MQRLPPASHTARRRRGTRGGVPRTTNRWKKQPIARLVFAPHAMPWLALAARPSLASRPGTRSLLLLFPRPFVGAPFASGGCHGALSLAVTPAFLRRCSFGGATPGTELRLSLARSLRLEGGGRRGGRPCRAWAWSEGRAGGGQRLPCLSYSSCNSRARTVTTDVAERERGNLPLPRAPDAAFASPAPEEACRDPAVQGPFWRRACRSSSAVWEPCPRAKSRHLARASQPRTGFAVPGA